MHDFSYGRAETIDAAVAAVVAGATPIAGGTELLNWLRLGAERIEAVIDIGGVDALHGIRLEGGVIRIGALTTLNAIEGSVEVREHAPLLAEACLKSAAAQVRNSATLGGNLLQQTRCPYYRVEAGNESRMPWACNKRQVGSGCSAQSGLYDRASLFGATDSCLCSLPSDLAAALAALDAKVYVVGPNGEREFPAAEFHLTQSEARDLITGGHANGMRIAQPIENAAADAALVNRVGKDGILTGCSFAVDAASRNSSYVKVLERRSFEFAKVAAAVMAPSRMSGTESMPAPIS